MPHVVNCLRGEKSDALGTRNLVKKRSGGG
jgi:hypothetical protein